MFKNGWLVIVWEFLLLFKDIVVMFGLGWFVMFVILDVILFFGGNGNIFMNIMFCFVYVWVCNGILFGIFLKVNKEMGMFCVLFWFLFVMLIFWMFFFFLWNVFVNVCFVVFIFFYVIVLICLVVLRVNVKDLNRLFYLKGMSIIGLFFFIFMVFIVYWLGWIIVFWLFGL